MSQNDGILKRRKQPNQEEFKSENKTEINLQEAEESEQKSEQNSLTLLDEIFLLGFIIIINKRCQK